MRHALHLLDASDNFNFVAAIGFTVAVIPPV